MRLFLYVIVRISWMILVILFPKSVLFISFVIESFQLVYRQLMKFVKIMPPFVTAAEFRIQVCVRNIAAHLRRHVKRTHRENVYSVARDRAKRRGNALYHPRVNVRTFTCRDMDSHSRSAEDERAFKFALRNFTSHSKPHAVKHIFRIVGIAFGGNAEIGDFPAFRFQMRHHRFFQRIPREIRAHYQVFIFYGLHFFTSVLASFL